jgi:peptide subunit release factor RF-3
VRKNVARASTSAGEVKARGERRRVRSDWMAAERRRGISVSSAVMSFEHEGLAFNLLDTPGHQNFSPVGFQRRHLPHPDCGRQRRDGARRRPQWRLGGSRSRPASSSIGIPNHGGLRIGDTLTESEAIRITGTPNFAPEILWRVANNFDRICFDNASPRS